jgi:hypothetical protein
MDVSFLPVCPGTVPWNRGLFFAAVNCGQHGKQCRRGFLFPTNPVYGKNPAL